MTTNRLRIRILRELYDNKDRQYADLHALRVLDTQGHEWVSSNRRTAVIFDDQQARLTFGESPSAWLAAAVHLEPTTARTVARLKADRPVPALLANRFGQGEAYLVATCDGNFGPEDSFWAGLLDWRSVSQRFWRAGMTLTAIA